MNAILSKYAGWTVVAILAGTPLRPAASLAVEPTTTLAAVDGACCMPDGLCYDFTPSSCTANGGDYQGDGTVCDIGVCPGSIDGACCMPNGLCYDFTPSS